MYICVCSHLGVERHQISEINHYLEPAPVAFGSNFISVEMRPFSHAQKLKQREESAKQNMNCNEI